MRIIFLMLLASIIFFGCSQDPLKDFPEYIREGFPRDGKPVEKGEAVSRDKILIELKNRDNLLFKEGIEKTINFDVRVLDPTLPKFTVSIENLPEGAIFDPKDNAFTWTPGENYVQNDSGIEFHFIDVEVVVPETIERAAQKRSEQYRLEIQNNVRKPEILSFTLSDSEFLEGKVGTFSAKVKDIDASLNFKPNVQILESDSTYYKSAAYLVNIESVERDESDSSLWHVIGEIDTSRAPIYMATEEFKFGIRAVSRYGVFSASKMGRFKIIHKPSSPIVTNKNKTYEVIRGEGNLIIDFNVVRSHPADQLSISWITDCTSLKGNVQCNCNTSDWVSQVSCQVIISPDKNTSSYAFEFETKVRNYYVYDEVLNEVHSFDVNVVDPLVEEPSASRPSAGGPSL